MKSVRIYTTSWCGFCHRAKQVLQAHDVPFDEIDVEEQPELRTWLRKVTGQHTVPQIFFGDDSIGGCTDLLALIAAGGLDARLGRTADSDVG
ncbi:MAG: glutaredoxin [Myxococcota bacterium]